jgi:hypothetical protein
MKQIDHLFEDLDAIYLDSSESIKTAKESTTHIAMEIQDLELLFKEHGVRANKTFEIFRSPTLEPLKDKVA